MTEGRGAQMPAENTCAGICAVQRGENRMIKRILLMAGIFFVAMMLSGCGDDLADCFDEDALEISAMAVIDDFNQSDYGNIMDKGNQVFVDSLTLAQWQETCDPYLEKLGTFDHTEGTVITGQKGSDGKDYAVIITVGIYSEGRLQFTVVYDTDMKLAQFFIR